MKVGDRVMPSPAMGPRVSAPGVVVSTALGAFQVQWADGSLRKHSEAELVSASLFSKALKTFDRRYVVLVGVALGSAAVGVVAGFLLHMQMVQP